MNIVSRMGGDEFCVVLPGANKEAADIYRNRFVAVLGACCEGVSVSIEVSVTGPIEYLEPELLGAMRTFL